MLYQLGALTASPAPPAAGSAYVKPHGALYNAIVAPRGQAARVVEAVRLRPVAAGARPARLGAAARGRGGRPAHGRRGASPTVGTPPAGTLVPRREPGAVLHDPGRWPRGWCGWSPTARSSRWTAHRGGRGRLDLRARRHPGRGRDGPGGAGDARSRGGITGPGPGRMSRRLAGGCCPAGDARLAASRWRTWRPSLRHGGARPGLRDRALDASARWCPAARTVLVVASEGAVRGDRVRRRRDARPGAATLADAAGRARRSARGLRRRGPRRGGLADRDQRARGGRPPTPERCGSGAFAGFAPGFGYLIGEDSGLHVPRRGESRTEVPAGAVGLAGEYSGVYPSSSPGGWQLIGRTDAVLWDLDREPAALLASGRCACGSSRPGRGPGGEPRGCGCTPSGPSPSSRTSGVGDWLASGSAAQGLRGPHGAATGQPAVLANDEGTAAVEVTPRRARRRGAGGGELVLRHRRSVPGHRRRSRRRVAHRVLRRAGCAGAPRSAHGRPEVLPRRARRGSAGGGPLARRSSDVMSGVGPRPLEAGDELPVGCPGERFLRPRHRRGARPHRSGRACATVSRWGTALARASDRQLVPGLQGPGAYARHELTGEANQRTYSALARARRGRTSARPWGRAGPTPGSA